MNCCLTMWGSVARSIDSSRLTLLATKRKTGNAYDVCSEVTLHWVVEETFSAFQIRETLTSVRG